MFNQTRAVTATHSYQPNQYYIFLSMCVRERERVMFLCKWHSREEKKPPDAKCFCGKWDKCNNEIVSNRNGIKFIFSALWIPDKMPATSQHTQTPLNSTRAGLFALLKFCSSGGKWKQERDKGQENGKPLPNINCLHSTQQSSAINYLGKYVLNVFLAAPFSCSRTKWQQMLGLIRLPYWSMHVAFTSRHTHITWNGRIWIVFIY